MDGSVAAFGAREEALKSLAGSVRRAGDVAEQAADKGRAVRPQLVKA
jgi:hypothetical protein